MTDTKHTPGPWDIAWENGKHGVIAAPCEEYEMPNGTKCKVRGVALILNPDEKRNDVRRANTNLIAAAPDLLEALEFIMSHDPTDRENTDVAINKSLRAIAKAKGEPQ